MDAQKILDSTKVKTFKTCPRKYFFEHVQGWNEQGKAHDLIFGIAFHKGLEVLYADWKRTGVPGYTDARIELAYETFLEEYRKSFPPETDELYEPKVPWNVLLMYKLYQEQYDSKDQFEILATELAGGLPITEDASIYFRLDTVCRDDRGVFILEHKTSKWRVDLWAASFKQSMQVGTGLYALNSVFEPSEVYGMVLQGFFFRKLPRLKNNGEPYANSSSGNEIVRHPIMRSGTRLQDWLTTTQAWVASIQRQEEILAQESEDDNVLLAFPKNEMGCLSYGRECQYADYCNVWPNPLGEEMPLGFEKRFWNPMEEPPAEGAMMLNADERRM